ncbi:MAG: PH domain-containing protein [Mycoplasmatales bacterium]
MALEIKKFEYTLHKEVVVPNDVNELLVDGEKALKAFKTFRDVAIITNKRFIIRDSQGLTGKKVEMYTIPFKSINMYSSENSGTIDLNSEIELWTRAGHFKLKLKKGIDIRALDKIIAEHIL